ncbi:MAG: hypothetical protein KZQ98_17795 [Candidatus Thiodiazotropha sp. (ex Lucinoma borealis)]|nr:hypothetical protein [Candidatus Thiodiazotropha sp. (ex Lucinoma borealis)]
MNPNEEAWIHGKILAESLLAEYKAQGKSLGLLDQSVRYFMITSSGKDESVLPARFRLEKTGHHRWRVRENKQVFEFNHQGKNFDVLIAILSKGIGDRSIESIEPFERLKPEAIRKHRDRAIEKLINLGAHGIAEFIKNAIKIHSDGVVTLKDPSKTDWLTFG